MISGMKKRLSGRAMAQIYYRRPPIAPVWLTLSELLHTAGRGPTIKSSPSGETVPLNVAAELISTFQSTIAPTVLGLLPRARQSQIRQAA